MKFELRILVVFLKVHSILGIPQVFRNFRCQELILEDTEGMVTYDEGGTFREW